jgi:hypothetical protein
MWSDFFIGESSGVKNVSIGWRYNSGTAPPTKPGLMLLWSQSGKKEVQVQGCCLFVCMTYFWRIWLPDSLQKPGEFCARTPLPGANLCKEHPTEQSTGTVWSSRAGTCVLISVCLWEGFHCHSPPCRQEAGTGDGSPRSRCL